jgi:hypothetical protein
MSNEQLKVYRVIGPIYLENRGAIIDQEISPRFKGAAVIFSRPSFLYSLTPNIKQDYIEKSILDWANFQEISDLRTLSEDEAQVLVNYEAALARQSPQDRRDLEELDRCSSRPTRSRARRIHQ